MRYVVTEPVPDGYQWWDIADTQNKSMRNFVVASFSVLIPGAENEARSLCARLNGGV